MPKGIMLTSEQMTARRHEILNIALDLFSHHGFEKTSMKKIADAAKMGKSSLYDFFRSKDELIVFAIEEELRTAIEKAKEIVTSETAPEQCLRALMSNSLIYNQKNYSLLMWLNTEAAYSAEEYQKRIKEIRHTYQDIVQSVIQQGITSGMFRPTDPALAARLLINSMLSIAYTSRPSDSMEVMLDEAMNIFLHGVMS